jgi:hypothetical protein
MSWEALSAIGSFSSAFVIAATAAFALIQIRQLRRSTQLHGFLELVREFHSHDIQAARKYVATELPAHMESEQYRNELVTFTADTQTHPELLLREFWEAVGGLMRHNVLDTPLFLDYFTIPCRLDWKRLAVVNAMLREINPYYSEEFEYIAKLCDQWFVSRRHGAPPSTRVRTEPVPATPR